MAFGVLGILHNTDYAIYVVRYDFVLFCTFPWFNLIMCQALMSNIKAPHCSVPGFNV